MTIVSLLFLSMILNIDKVNIIMTIKLEYHHLKITIKTIILPFSFDMFVWRILPVVVVVVVEAGATKDMFVCGISPLVTAVVAVVEADAKSDLGFVVWKMKKKIT